MIGSLPALTQFLKRVIWPQTIDKVFLTCVCCKLMEHILVRHMLRHFDDENIISEKQHGFRNGHSCETQLITIVDDLLASADVWNRVDIAILDFSKAFDMVSHRRLMSKLDHSGIRGNIHKWISSSLTVEARRSWLALSPIITGGNVDSPRPNWMTA